MKKQTITARAVSDNMKHYLNLSYFKYTPPNRRITRTKIF